MALGVHVLICMKQKLSLLFISIINCFDDNLNNRSEVNISYEIHKQLLKEHLKKKSFGITVGKAH